MSMKKQKYKQPTHKSLGEYPVRPTGIEYRVDPYVRDGELEIALNEASICGWEVKQMFRNSPAKNTTEETTTVVYERTYVEK